MNKTKTSQQITKTAPDKTKNRMNGENNKKERG